MPVDDRYLLSYLEQLGISTSTVEHEPLRTVEDARRARTDQPGGHVKNLFLKDKNKRFWLLVALEDTSIDLKATAQLLEAQKFSFASADELADILGIVPGAVSPFAVINDELRQVSVVLDQRLLEVSPLNFHPLRNDRTTTIATSDFLKFLTEVNHPPRSVLLPAKVGITNPDNAAKPHELFIP
jgi:Ala-tRNA(Pro) deacylase